jgi:hypothetical protein
VTEKVAWNVLAAMAALGAGWAAREAATALWHRASGIDTPEDPADRTVTWAQAASWALLAGLSGALAQLIARRGAATAWERVTGETPPGIRQV